MRRTGTAYAGWLCSDFPSFLEGLSLRQGKKSTSSPFENFPSFSEGLSLRLDRAHAQGYEVTNFPSFSEGLSLRLLSLSMKTRYAPGFPFLFGGTFIEGRKNTDRHLANRRQFPFLFGGTFIEGQIRRACPHEPTQISLPFRRDFH